MAQDEFVTVYFGTNRSLTGTKARPDFGQSFNPDGPGAIRLGYAEVPVASFKSDARLKDIRIRVADESIRLDKETDIKLGSREIFTKIQQKMRAHSRDTVAFLHGYANSFRNALRHAALLKVIYAVPFNMFLFSWPSDGEMVPFMSYYSDRDDAKASGLAVARTLLKLRDFLQGATPEEWCDQRLHLMAHSMGNYALRHGLQGLRHELGDDPPRLFDNIFLFAADEDDDAFEHDHKLRLLPRMARLVNLYFNPDDLALLISDKTKRNPDRLGSDGPRLVDDLPRKVVLLNCREVARTDPRDKRGHDYHRYVPEVIADVTEVLKGVPAEEIPGRQYMHASRSYRLQKK
ncbi:MAG: alpha/beta hydrolase [Rhodospirillales bacterium]|nr:alpha/beta hydrolase [Rhodospirillales bacterium]